MTSEQKDLGELYGRMNRSGIRNEKLSGASFLVLTPNSTPVMYVITSASLCTSASTFLLCSVEYSVPYEYGIKQSTPQLTHLRLSSNDQQKLPASSTSNSKFL